MSRSGEQERRCGTRTTRPHHNGVIGHHSIVGPVTGPTNSARARPAAGCRPDPEVEPGRSGAQRPVPAYPVPGGRRARPGPGDRCRVRPRIRWRSPYLRMPTRKRAFRVHHAARNDIRAGVPRRRGGAYRIVGGNGGHSRPIPTWPRFAYLGLACPAADRRQSGAAHVPGAPAGRTPRRHRVAGPAHRRRREQPGAARTAWCGAVRGRPHRGGDRPDEHVAAVTAAVRVLSRTFCHCLVVNGQFGMGDDCRPEQLISAFCRQSSFP